MLKDIQIAIRLGLSHHIELAITAATRDRLLEQMQQGREEEDYSVVARRYLPEIITPAAAEAAAPQLFSDQVPLVPFSEIQFQSEPAPQEPSSFVPLMPEMIAQESETTETVTAPAPENVEISVSSAEAQVEPENSSVATEDASESTPLQPEEQRETAQHEGLFGRWLHRPASSEKSSEVQE